jgi:hypothetical protein
MPCADFNQGKEGCLMNTVHKALPGFEALAFSALALGILGAAFFWMPAVAVCLAAVGLVIGFFGWITASQHEDGSAYYLMVGAVISVVSLLLNLTLVTGMYPRLF